MNALIKLTVLTAALLAAPSWAEPNSPLRQARGWSVSEIVWGRYDPIGTRYALLEGDTAAGPFSFAFFMPKGYWDPPHLHGSPIRIFVAQGALTLGYGDKIAPDRTVRYPVGSFLVVPEASLHFIGATEDTVIIVTTIGPWSASYTGINPVANYSPIPRGLIDVEKRGSTAEWPVHEMP